MTETKKMVTPIGQLNWVNISGEGKKGFEDDDPREYVASLILDEKETEAFMKELKEFFKANTKPNTVMHWPKAVPIKDMDGKTPELFEAGDPRTIFQAKTRTHFQDGKKKIIKLYNSTGKEFILPEDKQVGNGSRGRLNVTAAITSFKSKSGVSLYLNSIQFAKFVEYVEDSGFDEMEGVEDDGTSTVAMESGADTTDPIDDGGNQPPTSI